MSAIVKKTYRHSLVAGSPGGDQLERFGFGDMNGAPVEREVGYDNAAKRLQVRTATATETLAFMSDLNQFGRYRGGYDASGGAVPTSAALTAVLGDQAVGTPINAGDEILITVGGTIAGLANGASVLQPGDQLKAISDNATLPAHFIAIERNQPAVTAILAENVAVAALAADTVAAVTLTNTYTRIKSVSVFDSTGVDITSSIVVSRPTVATVSIASSVALSNLVVEVLGLG